MNYISYFKNKARFRKNKNEKFVVKKCFDRLFLIYILLLSAFGSIMVFTSGYAYASFRYGDAFYFVKRQIIWLTLGIIVMILAKNISVDLIKSLSLPLYVFTLFLLVLTLIIGFVGNGAQRWISIGPITVQPSEIAKFTLVLMLAKYYSDFEVRACAVKKKSDVLLFGTLIPFAIMLFPIFLVMLQKHLSCIIILGTIGVLVMVISGINTRYLSYCIGGGALGVGYIAFFTDYTKERITVWQDPEKYKLTGGWQTLQGLMAIGSGGFFGKGLGRGQLKYCYVSEPANDMIFAILCEELGFVGAFVAFVLFALLIFEGFKIAFKSKSTFERLLVFGICSQIAVQVLLNVAVVTNTIPNTGISLPFFSYGGSSLVMLFFEMGLVLSVSRNSRIQK